MKVGRRVKALREQRGLSQTALARRARISKMQLYRVETDRSSPVLRTLERVARALGVKVRDLLD